MSERTQVCGGCRQRKYLRDYYFITERERHSTICKTCTRAQRHASAAARRFYCTDCGTRIPRSTLCNACRQAKREQVEKTLAPVPLSPGVCGLPERGGGRCLRAVDDGTDSNGRATLYCPVHGERYAPVIRPPNFVRHDQRERFEAAIRALKVTTPVDPEASKRAQGRTAVTIQKAGNFQIIGRERQRQIDAA